MRYTGKQIKQNTISHDWLPSKCAQNVYYQTSNRRNQGLLLNTVLMLCTLSTHDSTTPGAYVWYLAGTILHTFTSVVSFMEPVPPHKVSTTIFCIYKQGSWSTDSVIPPSSLAKDILAIYPMQHVSSITAYNHCSNLSKSRIQPGKFETGDLALAQQTNHAGTVSIPCHEPANAQRKTAR